MPTEASAIISDSEPPVARRLSMGFGVGALGMAIVLNTPAGILAPFMTNYLGIGAGTVAALFLVSKLYDMVTDPLMGVLSDQANTRWGRRRPYLFLGGVISAIGFAMLFNPPVTDSQTLLIAYMLGALLLLYSGYTVFNIPYLAMPAEMTQSYHGRTSLMTYRMMFVNVGGLLASGSFAFVQWLGSDRAAHGTIGLLFALIIVFATTACFFGTAGAKQTVKSSVRVPFKDQLKTAIENRPFLLLISAKLCQLIGFTSVGATGVYFKVVILKLDYQITSAYLIATTAAVLIALPIWNRIAKSQGKLRVYIFCAGCYAVITLTWLFATPDDPLYHIFVRGIISGTFGAGVLVMGPSLLPDTIEYDYLRTGLRREGVIAAFYTTIEKLSFAIGPSIILFFLGWFGYEAGTQGLQVEQPESAITAIYLGAAVVPAVLYVISIGFLLKYDLSEDKLKAMRVERSHPSVT